MSSVNDYYTYSSDPYWNWQTWEGRDPNFREKGDNARFASEFKSRMNGAPKVKRGFIRSAQPEVYGDQRCFFQYNPNQLVRETTQMTDVLDPQYQTAADLAVPGSGSTSFSFALLFDRQGEVASGQSRDPRSQWNSKVKDPVADPLSDTPYNPYLGVMADIRVLDSIIGVGINTDSSRKQTGGNQALQYARPVRVVFSSLFMVEGWVTGTSVSYTKFNTAMVPTVAAVSLLMDARYIGYAVEKTGIILDPAQLVGSDPNGDGVVGSVGNGMGTRSNPDVSTSTSRYDTRWVKPT